jgi:homoserine dehydrogenase
MSARPVTVALLGCGVVGSGFARIAVENAADIERRVGRPLRIRGIAVRNVAKPRPEWIDRSLLCGDARSLIADPEVDIVAECIGGTDAARDYVDEALRAGKHVATANKELMAKHGHELCHVADGNGVALRYEGSVAGGIPLITPIRTSLAADRIERVLGILNGTTNYILTRMSHDGLAFSDALAEAQERGFAEADPTDDVEGFDAAYKLTIVASIAFGRSVALASVYREGITGVTATDIAVAAKLGYVVKLLAIAKRDAEDRLELRVHPTLLPKAHPLASVSNEFNAVFINARHAREVMFFGPGAGMGPTGSSVAGDVVDIARDIVAGARARIRCTCVPSPDVSEIGDIWSRFYLRLITRDRPGVLGSIALILGEYEIGLSTVYQEPLGDGRSQIVAISDPAQERDLRAALREIERLPSVFQVAATLRVED